MDILITKFDIYDQIVFFGGESKTTVTGPSLVMSTYYQHIYNHQHAIMLSPKS